MASTPSPALDDRRAASTDLVFDSPFDPPAGQPCPLLRRSTSPGARNVLAVLLTESPERHVRSWQRSEARPPERLRIVCADPGSTPSADDSPRPVERVGSPADLTGLGVAITAALSEWEGDGREIDVCFDSLTPLLQYVDLDRAARFLHELANQFDAADASAHVHVDPDAHDRETLDALKPLFDGVVDADDGE